MELMTNLSSLSAGAVHICETVSNKLIPNHREKINATFCFPDDGLKFRRNSGYRDLDLSPPMFSSLRCGFNPAHRASLPKPQKEILLSNPICQTVSNKLENIVSKYQLYLPNEEELRKEVESIYLDEAEEEHE